MTMALTQVTGSTGVKKPVDFADNEKARFGASQDLEIYHDGSNGQSIIKESGPSVLKIQGSDVRISNTSNSADYIQCNDGAAVVIKHNGSTKFTTKSDGIDVTGEVQCDSLDVDGTSDLGGNVTVSSGNLTMHSAGRIYSGNGGNASAPMIANGSDTNTGIAFPAADTLLIATGGGTAARFNGGGSSQLYHNNVLKLETNSGGVDVTGELECDTLDVQGVLDIHATRISYDTSNEHLKFLDNIELVFGHGDDLKIWHDGNNSRIHDQGTGGLIIQGDAQINLQSASNENYIECVSNGAVTVYYNNSAKLATKSDGVDILGELQCDSLDNDGASSFAGIATFNGNYTSFNNNGYIRGDSSGVFQLQAGGNNVFRFMSADNGTKYVEINSGGLNPGANNTYDLGTSSVRWRNVYTNDLNLSNEGSANDVDGTWGNFTIQEGEDDLFLINRRSGKKYKFNLTEVN